MTRSETPGVEGNVEIRLAGPADIRLFDRIAEDVFDHRVDPAQLRAFLDDPRHHIVLARHAGRVVGFVSAVDYLHPDKPPTLWINEVGVAEVFRRRGVARRMLDRMLAHGEALGCAEAWVATEEDNAPARGLYRATGSTETPGIVMYTYAPRAGWRASAAE